MPTLTQKLSAVLRAQIESGEFAAGSRLPTLRELEQLHGVSEITVRAALRELRDQGLVEMKPRVGTVVCAPPEVASQEPNQPVALVVPALYDTFFSRMAQGAQAEFARQGRRLLLVTTDGNLEKEARELQALAGQVAGVLIFPVDVHNPAPLQRLQETGAPVVFIDRVVAGVTAPLVSVNNEEAGFLAARHLLELGRPTWVFSNPLAWIAPVDDRIRGFGRALQTLGLPLEKSRILQKSDMDEAIGAGLARQILELPETRESFAVLCINDAIARGAYAVFGAAGISIPGHVALVGFGDSIAPLLDPPLSGVRLDEENWGRQAAILLDALLRGESISSPAPLVPELVVRASCGTDTTFCRVEALLQSAHHSTSNHYRPPVLV